MNNVNNFRAGFLSLVGGLLCRGYLDAPLPNLFQISLYQVVPVFSDKFAADITARLTVILRLQDACN